MRKVNGYQYSRGSFPEYKTRVKILIWGYDNNAHYFDLYTTRPYENDNKDEFKSDIISDLNQMIVKEKVKKLQITYLCSKEQDEKMKELLFSVFKV